MTESYGEDFDKLLRAVATSPNVAPIGRSLGERFLLRRRLGEGGFGVVYEADDLRDGGRVALKLLRRPEPKWLYSFKREFRALQGLSHPNLVALDELFGDGDRWFFTMELVDGIDFITHARGTSFAPSNGAAPLPFHEGRLRDGLRQLLEGLTVLHVASKVHRDIKPSNVLVTREGRVVLIDFGLVTDPFHTMESGTLGTPAYMAPEQANMQEVGPAADLYALGVMLFELLTGRMPIEGTALQILVDKQTREPPAPASLVPGVPADLNQLCIQLLRIDPSQRPSAAEVFRALGGDQPRAAVPVPRPPEVPMFVGRDAGLAQLRAAFECSGRGRLTTVLIKGESGIGKTCLVRHFVDHLLAGQPDTLLLEGRCHEREAIPYKTLDGIVDALGRRLSQMSTSEAAALLPTRCKMLVRIFPALLRIPALAMQSGHTDATAGSQVELRQRAFLELREFFTRVAMRCPTVVAIDDLQWADDDGLRALAEILRAPEAPPLLFIGVMRVTAGAPQPPADRFREIFHNDTWEIEVKGLSDEESRRLATSLLERTSTSKIDPGRIVAEAGGHPLFVEELARHAALGSSPEEVNLDTVLGSRVAQLESPARDLVELIAVAGKPLQQDVAAVAARLEPAEFHRWVAVLRASHLVRTTGASLADLIDAYHDRVREVVQARLGPARRCELHGTLARAFEASSHVDAETLAMHWREADDPIRAGDYSAAAGDQASQTFAFDRAAAWFDQALHLLPAGHASRGRLHIKLGEALAFAGRGGLAAPHFEAAANASQAGDALELRRRAAEQLLRTGHFDRGIEASRVVLTAIGMRLPSTRFQTLTALGYYSLRLRLRGLGFRERTPEQITPEERMRIDTCFSMAAGLGFVDTVVGFVFQKRALLLALAAGDLDRIARAMGMEVAYSGMSGGSTWRRTERLIRHTRELAQRSGSMQARVFAMGTTGMAFYSNGRFREAADAFTKTLDLLEDGSTGLVHERVTSRMFTIWSLAYLGRFKELCRRQREGLGEALARDDAYATVNLRIGFPNLAWLIQDRSDLAESEMNEAMRQWSKRGFHLEHSFALNARVWIKLYTGDVEQAHTAASELLHRVKRSLLWRLQSVRARALYARGATALGMLQRRFANAEVLLGQVARDARAIERERMEWTSPFARVLRAGLAFHRGDRVAALGCLDQAAREYDRLDMMAYAAAVRDRAARLRNDDSASATIARTAALLEAEEVAMPDRLLAILVPGLVAV